MAETAVLTLTDFLLARIAEDEEAALEAMGYESRASVSPAKSAAHYARWDPDRVVNECETKRRIVETESRWRRAKGNVIESETRKIPDDTVRVIWDEGGGHLHEESMTRQEFHRRFTEPAPPSHTLKLLAQPYAEHPDFREEWRG